VDSAFAKWRFLYGTEGGSWLAVMLQEYYEQRPLSIDQAIFAVDSWARTSVLLYEEVGFERLYECQTLALATTHPHLELRRMYLDVVSG
jgi:hypothetical protein